MTPPTTGGGAPGSAPEPPGRAALERRLPKRFYERAYAEPGDDGHHVMLDDRPIHTPCKARLMLSSAQLARAVAEEWAAQESHIDPETMPLTKLANTALDRVRGREPAVADEIVGYAASDLLCYRADQPRQLVACQAELWDPVLAWMADHHGARFDVAVGVIHVTQPAESLNRLRDALCRFDAFGLTALHNMTTLTGSALLALAHAEGRLSCDQAWKAAHVDEDWQVSQWGEDLEATARRDRRYAEMVAAANFLRLLQNS